MQTYQVGDDVSYGINGDSYYAGKIVRMTKCYLWTDTGQKFTLRGDYYRMTGNKWCWLSKGRREHLDPHF